MSYADRFVEIPEDWLREGFAPGSHAAVPGYDRLLPVDWRARGSSSRFSTSVYSAGHRTQRSLGLVHPHIDRVTYPEKGP